MRNKGQLILGGIVLLFGLFLLIGNLLNLNLWKFFWPLALMAIGVFVIFRQGKAKEGTMTYFSFARGVNRSGEWEIHDAEYWNFAADFDLDLTQANIPAGEAHWRAFGFVNELRLRISPVAGVSVTTHAFVTEKKIDGNKEDLFLVPLEWQSDNFETASEKFYLELNGFVSQVRIIKVDKSTTTEA